MGRPLDLPRGSRPAGGLVALLLACAGCAESVPVAPPGAPNVVLVVVDTLRADRISHYGYARETGVLLDGFRSHATLFESCRAPASWTRPSVASLLTGLHCARHRVTGRDTALPDEAETLAETLRARGWQTAGWSFNHMVSRQAGFGQGYEHFDDHLGTTRDFPDAEELVRRVASWLPERRDAPFFLFAQPMNAHGPYRVPKEHERTLLGRTPSPEFRYFGQPMAGILYGGKLENRRKVNPRYLRALAEHYDTAVRYSLDQVAELFALLEESGEYDDSLIVLTSDHGEEMFEHGGFAHGYSLHDEVLHVPLYVKLPGQREARTVTADVSLLDVLPTILDVLDVPVPLDLDGRSLAGLCAGETSELPDEPRVFQVDWPERCVADALVADGYKLISIRRNYEGLRRAVRLYDVTNDPGETTDLAAEHPDVVERMTRELERRLAAYGERALAGSAIVELDAERLEALGYTDSGE